MLVCAVIRPSKDRFGGPDSKLWLWFYFFLNTGRLLTHFFLWRKWFFDEKRFWNEAVLSFLVLGRKCNWGILSQAKTGGRKWAGDSEPGDCRALPSTPLSHFPRADVNLKLIKPMRLQIKGCVIGFRYLQLESLNLKFRVCAWRICKRNGTQVDNLDRHWSI